MEATRLFRLAVDGYDVKKTGTEPDRSLWKLLPLYGMRWNTREGNRRNEIEMRLVTRYSHIESQS